MKGCCMGNLSGEMSFVGVCGEFVGVVYYIFRKYSSTGLIGASFSALRENSSTSDVIIGISLSLSY